MGLSSADLGGQVRGPRRRGSIAFHNVRASGAEGGAGDFDYWKANAALRGQAGVPVPAREIPFVDLESIDVASKGMSPGMKVLIGAGASLATIAVIGLVALASAYDRVARTREDGFECPRPGARRRRAAD